MLLKSLGTEKQKYKTKQKWKEKNQTGRESYL